MIVVEKKIIPKGWIVKQFDDCVILPAKIKGLKNSEYKTLGKYPVFDQAQEYISGFADKDDFLNTKIPAILFGDHTRILKYIQQPFVLGADGTKVFWVKDDINPDFLFYSLLNQEIPNTGYNRHFKYLKEKSILIPPQTEQTAIAEILSTVDEEIQKTDEIIFQTEKLKKGLMRELFTMKKWREIKLGDICDFTTGKLNSNQAVEDGQYPFFTCSQDTFLIDRYSFDQEAVLLAGNNAAGNYSVKYYNGKFDAYQRTYVISVKDKNQLDHVLLKEILNTKLNKLKSSSVGTNTQFLTLKLLLGIKIILPPIKEQKKIVEISQSIDENISVNKKIKDKLNLLKKGLMQDLLSGKVRIK